MLLTPLVVGVLPLYMNKIITELKNQERSLSWLSRKVGLHYQTVIRWKDSGVPRWHWDKIAEVLNKSKDELFSE